MKFRKLCFKIFLLILPWFIFPRGVIAQGGVIDLPGVLSATNKGSYWDFTYSESGWLMTGSITKPASSSGQFRGIVISHGKGGNAYGFSLGVATNWFPDYVSVNPNYTHAGGGFGTGVDEGGSAENVKRATKALDILQSQELANLIGDIVDRGRLYLYGNSMGGFVVIETSSKVGTRVRGAAYTASGLCWEDYPPGAPACSGNYTPSGPEQAKDVQAPFLMLHGTNDGTADPIRSQAWADALASYGKTYNLVWFEGYGHDIASNPATSSQCRDLIRSWFTGQSPSFTPTPSPPKKSGDANADGNVNGIDFTVWLRNFGKNLSGTVNGDYDGNGNIGIPDYLVWLLNYLK